MMDDQERQSPTATKPTTGASAGGSGTHAVSSGIPRPSKLPIQTSKLPVPRSSSIRHAPSRETLATTSNATNVGAGVNATLRNPKLRTAASRDQLDSNLASPAAANRSQPAFTKSPRAASSPQPRVPLTQPGASATRSSRYGHNTSAYQQAGKPAPSAAGQVSRTPSTVRSIPRRQPSQQWISAASVDAAEIEESNTPTETPPRSYGDAATKIVRSVSDQPKLSLAERTIETLSRLPSSPSVRGKAGALSFFDPPSATKKPPSRPSSRHSRPGSSHQSEGSSQDRPGSSGRPGSSSGPEETVSSFRSNISVYKSSLSTIEGTPLRNRRSIQSFQPLMSSSKTTPGKGVRSSVHGIQPPAGLHVSSTRTPSPEKARDENPTSKFGSKTLAARPTKKPSVNGLFKKPSMPALAKPAVETPRKASMTSRKSSATSNEMTTPGSASIKSAGTAITTNSSELAPSQNTLTVRKSSAALREQIAKAKAARQAPKISNPLLEAPQGDGLPFKSLLIPKDNTFDFGLSNDPFNLRRDDQAQAKILQGRLQTARTSGRLNIAALDLKEIPSAVMDMYNLESVDQSGGAWAESVDLTRFVAADNEIEMIDDSVFPDVDPASFADDEDSQGNIFAGIETLDLHGNMLIALPLGLRRLSMLTSLNLSGNRLANNNLEVICQIKSLRDLKLGGNLLYGPLDPAFCTLPNLEILDLHNNNIESVPTSFKNLARLRILNISENSLETLPFHVLATMPLTEISARKNQLSGTLIPEPVGCFPTLQSLDVSSNQLSHLCPEADEGGEKGVTMPALTQLCLSMNRLQSLPDISGWKKLVTLSADENSINAIPAGFTTLPQLRSVDFSSNDIRVIPPEIGRMDNLAVLRLSGNPLREKKFSTMDTEELKAILAQRLEPPPDHLAPELNPDVPPQPATTTLLAAPTDDDHDDSRSDSMDDFATPPTSAPGSPILARSRAQTLTGQQTWPVKVGGVLDRSHTQSSTLHPVTCSKVATTNRVHVVHLHHNLFTALPDSLSFFGSTMTALSLAHNQLVGESYMGSPGDGNEGIDLPVLKELNLSSNHITGLGPLLQHLRAPALQKLDVSCNRISSLPPAGQLRERFPSLTVLLVANNHLADLDPESIRGLKVVDAANNDIAHLNPRLGLLGGDEGLEKLDVTGNRFRVPRWNVLERGTEATLRWLRGRVPVAEMGQLGWKGDADGDGTGVD